MYFYACFRDDVVEGHRFRFDTRIYLNEHRPEETDERTGECIAAVVLQNPGSAQPDREQPTGVWGQIASNGDPTLNCVRACFLKAHQGEAIPPNAYVQVWNLFCLCDPRAKRAWPAFRAIIPSPPPCPTEEIRQPKVVWYAWGSTPAGLNRLKDRFLSRHQVGFYIVRDLDRVTYKVVRRAPSATDRVRHPARLSELDLQPVVQHLATVLCKHR